MHPFYHSVSTISMVCSHSRATTQVICGGLTNAKKYLAVAESYSKQTEVMSWGNTLGSAANLHLMCSSPACEVSPSTDSFTHMVLQLVSELIHSPNSSCSHYFLCRWLSPLCMTCLITLLQWFEMAVPYEPYEYGMLDTLRPSSDGMMHCPSGPGFGLRVDWDAMDAATILKFTVGE